MRGKDGNFAGAWLVSFSLLAVVNKYKPAGNEWGEFWVLDEDQQIIIYRDSSFIEKNIKEIFTNTNALNMDFSSDDGGYFQSDIRLSDKKQQRSIIAYYPLKAGDKKKIFLAVFPYSQVISPLRKTFFYTFLVRCC